MKLKGFFINVDGNFFFQLQPLTRTKLLFLFSLNDTLVVENTEDIEQILTI